MLFKYAIALSAIAAASAASFPVVINTWFANANNLTFSMLQAGYTALDSVEMGCTLCEDEQCDGTVGYGGSVDAYGDVSLDALIMDAETHDVGAVTNLRYVRHAISAARKVLHYSTHTLLSGSGGEGPGKKQGAFESAIVATSPSSVRAAANFSVMARAGRAGGLGELFAYSPHYRLMFPPVDADGAASAGHQYACIDEDL